MTRLTVVIPALNEQDQIEATLAAAAQGRAEVLLVDGGSHDATLQAVEGRARVLHSEAGRARQLHVGLQSATSDSVLFCHADTRLPAGYDRAIANALEDPAVLGGAFTARYQPRHWLLALAERLVALPTPLLMFGDQALFARRHALSTIGGVPQLPLMEDVAMMKALNRHGTLVRLPQQVTTSSRRFMERGVLRQLVLDLALLLAFHLGVSPDRLARFYYVSKRDRNGA